MTPSRGPPSITAKLRQKANPESVEGSRWIRMRIHRVSNKAMADFARSSKLNATRNY